MRMRLQFQHIVTITTSMGGGDGTRQIYQASDGIVQSSMEDN